MGGPLLRTSSSFFLAGRGRSGGFVGRFFRCRFATHGRFDGDRSRFNRSRFDGRGRASGFRRRSGTLWLWRVFGKVRLFKESINGPRLGAHHALAFDEFHQRRRACAGARHGRLGFGDFPFISTGGAAPQPADIGRNSQAGSAHSNSEKGNQKQRIKWEGRRSFASL